MSCSTSPPLTPTRSHSTSTSTSTHSHASPDLRTPAGSSHAPSSPQVEELDSRPETPLDFALLPSKATAAVKMTSSSTPSIAESISARSDNSEILPRPSVDPGIRGVPQGWEDDPSVPLLLPSPSTSVPTTPQPDPRIRSISRPGLRVVPGEQQQHHTRLTSFRGGLDGTRFKLSTWRDKAFPELADRTKRRADIGPKAFDREVVASARTKGPAPGSGQGMPSGPHQTAPASTVSRISYDLSSSIVSTGTAMSSSARLGVSIPATSDVPTTKASTIGSDEDFADLFTPGSKLSFPASASSDYPLSLSGLPRPSFSTSTSAPGLSDRDTRSITSTSTTSTTHRNRDRVMGLGAGGPSRPALNSNASRLFSAPDVHDVLPFGSGRLGSAWEYPSDQDAGGAKMISPIKSNIKAAGKGRRTSMSLSNPSEERIQGRLASGSTTSGLLVPGGQIQEGVEGWKDRPKPASGTGQKRVWLGPDGQEVAGVYRVGWEKEVMDVEARLHEAMYDLAGERHSFLPISEGKEPRTVLDLTSEIGTGLGLWPVSQALIWRDTQFVGLDIAPCQLDLTSLAQAERVARSSSKGSPAEEGLWEGIEKRVRWDRGNLLNTLPYDTGVFDVVHLRFLSLGIPESAWPTVLDEALRVLAPGGHLEIVDMSLSLSSTSPASLQRSFASVLLAEMVNPDPSLPIQFALPTLDGVRGGMGRPVFESKAEGVLAEAGWTWVRSTLDYKGTGIDRAGGKDLGMVQRIKGALRGTGKWSWADDVDQLKAEVGEESGSVPATEVRNDRGAKVWAWVGQKKS